MDLKHLARNASAILEAVVDAIVTIDVDGIMQSCNQAAEDLFGYTHSELIGAPVTMLMPEPYRSAHQRFVDNYLGSNDAKIIGIGRELKAVRKDGVEFPIYLAVSAVENTDHLHFVGIIRDLSEQKAAQEALMEQQEQMAQVGRLSTMGEMTASIAHEINQPLTAIAMYAQACIRILSKPEFDRDKVLDALQKLNDQSIRAGDVIERIQKFVQNVPGEKQWISINQLLREISRLAAGDARLHGIELNYNLDASEPKTFCDPIQIQQVALNLVRNAIDAMYEIDCVHGNRIDVESSVREATIADQVAADKVLEVRIVDQGTGIARDHLDKIFESFHTTKAEGVGMGLSISRSIIESHDGRLNFTNNEGHGAAFYFCLPVIDALEEDG